MHRALGVAAEDDKFLTHPGDEEVAGLGIWLSWPTNSQARVKSFSSSSR